MKTTRTGLALLGALSCLALAATAPADARPRKQAAKPPAAAPAAVPTATAEEQRAAANAEQAKVAQTQAAANAANMQAYQDSVRARDEQIARDKAAYEASVKKWEADVAACQAGDVSKCAKPA